MGITTDNFFEKIYSVIFSPKAFFEKENENISLRVAAGTVVIVTLLYQFALGIFDGSILNVTFIFTLTMNVLSALVMWFFTALFFEYIAKIFGNENKFQKMLYYSAFASVPYIFFAPLNLFKKMGEFGYVLASDIQFLLYLWIIILYVFAVRAAYNISLSRAVMLIILPFISVVFAIYWLVCFLSKMGYIFSV